MKILELGSGEGNKKWDTLDVRKLKGLTYSQSAVDLSNIPDETYDKIMTNDMIEHISWSVIEKALSEWYRVLKTGGTIEIETPSTEELKELLNNPKTHLYRCGEESDFTYFSRVAYGEHNFLANHHASYFNPEWLEELLTQTGFKDIKIIWENICRFRMGAVK